MTRPHAETCQACEQPIVGDEWVWRHCVSDSDADRLDLTSGDYHEACCPQCRHDIEAVS